MRKHRVNHEQQRTRNPARADGAAHDLSVLLDALGANVERNDRTEVERCDGVHRLIACLLYTSYPLTVGLTCVQSVTEALAQSGLSIPLWTNAVASLPLTQTGFGWVLPALIGLLLGLVFSSRAQTTA